jgi:glycogen debranching enzyme
VRYPVACLPQAWASASVFLLLQAVLGLKIDAGRELLVFERPTLPTSLRRLHVRGLRARTGKVDITFTRYAGDVAVELDDRVDNVEVMIIK